MKLNDAQKLAVETLDGHILIVAGAGSGKTRVLTERIVRLVEDKNVDVKEIVAITFTNKAAREMRERIEKRLGEKAQDMHISTFHSLCIEILRDGLPNGFYTLSESDQIDQVHAHMTRLDICTRSFDPRTVLKYISDIKNGVEIKEGIHKSVAESVLELYQDTMKTYKSFDYDDLITETLSLLKSNSNVRQKYQKMFRYIHVDEYQDTNHMQYELVKILSSYHGNLCVVGDPDQSIYRFRGADITIILNFESYFNDVAKIMLEQNYRSTRTIVDASNHVIAKNTYRLEKNVFTANDEGAKIIHYAADDERDEAEYVAKSIFLQQEEGISLSEMAILYRSHRLSYYIKERLDFYEIPYKVVEKTSMYDLDEVKIILDLVKFLLTPDNSFLQVSLSDKLGPKFDTFLTDFDNILAQGVEHVVKSLGSYVGCENKQAISDLRAAVHHFGSFEEFFMQVPKDIEKSEEMKEEKVTLMTLHGSKGLEYDCTYIIGMEEGTFPSKRSFNDSMDLEEERRLAYVGMTRAKKQLYLTRAKVRNKCSMYPSRFLYDIPEELMETNELPDRKVYVINSIGIFEQGDMVRHNTFGKGKIENIYKAGTHVVFDVNFDTDGHKKLIAYSAVLEKILT